MEEMRINKFLSEFGVCSRRAADRLIEEKRVTIDGIPATIGQKVAEGQEVCVDGKPVAREHHTVFLAVNKPTGIVCSAEEKDNIVDFVGYPERVYPVGRLDKHSRGLILMTNEGALVNDMLRARNYHEKEYEVTVDRMIDADFIKKMSSGIYLKELDKTTRPCKVTKLSDRKFSIILTQGLNRQIRRMCSALSYKVTDLKRVRFLTVELGSLPEGSYRELTPDEILKLRSTIS